MMLFFDTETTAKDPKAARLVQIAAVLCENDFTERAAMNLIIRPEGFVITPDLTAIHGISHTLAMKCGVLERHAVGVFLGLLNSAEQVVGHNVSYDVTVIDGSFRRIAPEGVNPKIVWPKVYCTMRATTDICKLPGRYGEYKWPRLSEAYAHFFPGETFAAHTALGDVRACMRLYQAVHTGAES